MLKENERHAWKLRHSIEKVWIGPTRSKEEIWTEKVGRRGVETKGLAVEETWWRVETGSLFIDSLKKEVEGGPNEKR